MLRGSLDRAWGGNGAVHAGSGAPERRTRRDPQSLSGLAHDARSALAQPAASRDRTIITRQKRSRAGNRRYSREQSGTPPTGSCAASPARQASPNESDRIPRGTRSSRPRSTRASRYATSKKPPATPTPYHHAL